MKKNLLFVIDSLHCAGAEKSLVTLLRLLDYSKYNVDLQLFGYGGVFEELLPKEVNLLSPLEYTKFSELSLKKSIIHCVKKVKIDMLRARIKYSMKIRKKKYNCAEEARIFWENTSSVIEKKSKEYDVAISYAQAIPTFYVAEKIVAKKKFAWVNVSYRLNDVERMYHEQFYDKFNKIVAVSDSTKEVFLETFNRYKDKVDVIYDINDVSLMIQMSENGESYSDSFKGVRILTIGRLTAQKGYDIAIDVCSMLKKKGVNFRWYVLGVGPQKEEILNSIREKKLEDKFKLLGVKSNPYPFIKECDIYVQTSKFEGFGLALAEARMLNKLVVTTRFDAVYNQMVNEKNGLVVDMNEQGVCDGISRLLEDKKLVDRILEYLKIEKKGNVEEINKFYKLIK